MVVDSPKEGVCLLRTGIAHNSGSDNEGGIHDQGQDKIAEATLVRHPALFALREHAEAATSDVVRYSREGSQVRA